MADDYILQVTRAEDDTLKIQFGNAEEVGAAWFNTLFESIGGAIGILLHGIWLHKRGMVAEDREAIWTTLRAIAERDMDGLIADSGDIVKTLKEGG